MWRRFARLWEKTSDAQFPEDGGDLGNRPEGLLTAARLRADRHCAEDLPLCLPRAAMTVSFRERLRRLAAERRRFGCRRLHIPLRREGIELNYKKLFSGSTGKSG
jgi:hypothetical protein